MTDVSPYSLGIEVSMRANDGSRSIGHFDPIIERNSPVPISRVKTYYPIQEGQPQVDLEVYQGEARMVRDNIRLGRLGVQLPRGPVEESGVDVRFTYDVNGLLQVEATVAKTGQTHALLIQGNPGMLTEQEIAQRLEALEKIKVHPRDRVEQRMLLARAERIYQQLRGSQREWLGQQIMAFERVLDSQDDRQIAPQKRNFAELLEGIERDSFLNPPPDGAL